MLQRRGENSGREPILLPGLGGKFDHEKPGSKGWGRLCKNGDENLRRDGRKPQINRRQLIPRQGECKWVQPIVDDNGYMAKERRVLENSDGFRKFCPTLRWRGMATLEEAHFKAFEEIKSTTRGCQKRFGHVVRAKGQREAFCPACGRENDILQHLNLNSRGLNHGIRVLL